MSQQYQQPIPLQTQPQPVYAPNVQGTPAPAVAAGSPSKGFPNVVVETPTWKLIVRGVQILISIIVLGLSAHIIHGAYMDQFGLAIAVAVLTWAGLAYILVTEKVTSLRSAYVVFAVLAVDLFLVIMWLATMGATAAMRAAFKYTTYLSGCYDDGSLIDSTVCFKKMKRASFVAGKVGLAEMTTVACISALNFILFAVCFVTTLLAYLRQRNAVAPGAPVVGGGEKQQTIVAQQPYGQQPAAAFYPTQPAAPVPVQQPIQPQYTGGYPQQQQPVQPQYTGSTFSQQQPIQPQYTGGNPYPPAVSPAPVQTYAQELPGQGPISPPNSPPPPQQGYAHPQ